MELVRDNGCTKFSVELVIHYTDDITNLDPLIDITYIKGKLEILSNKNLKNIDGLRNLTAVGGGLVIVDNENLKNIDGLKNLAEVGAPIIIRDNNLLENVDGLIGIASGSFQIVRNDSLANLDGLSSLTEVGDLGIHGNHALANINGLSNVKSISQIHPSWGLAISDNDSLANLNGLSSLEVVHGAARLADNDSLSDCQALAVAMEWPDEPVVFDSGTVRAGHGRYDIMSNAKGCNSISEIFDSVSLPTQPLIIDGFSSGTEATLTFEKSVLSDSPFSITGYAANCRGSTANVAESPEIPFRDDEVITRTLSVTGFDPVSLPQSVEVHLSFTHERLNDFDISLTTPQGTTLPLVTYRSTQPGPSMYSGVIIIESLMEPMNGDWDLRIEDIDQRPQWRGTFHSWGLSLTEILAATGDSSPLSVGNLVPKREYSCTVAPEFALGRVPISEPYTVKELTAEGVFSRLLKTVTRIREEPEGSADGRQTMSRKATDRGPRDTDSEPSSIPTLPTLGFFILSGLVGLFGIRRLANR